MELRPIRIRFSTSRRGRPSRQTSAANAKAPRLDVFPLLPCHSHFRRPSRWIRRSRLPWSVRAGLGRLPISAPIRIKPTFEWSSSNPRFRTLRTIPNRVARRHDRLQSSPAQQRFPFSIDRDDGRISPLAKFAGTLRHYEAADPVVPVTVRNLEPELEGARFDVKGSPPATISSVRELLDRIDATFWKVPTPDARTTLTWLNRVADAKRHYSVFAGTESGAKSFEMPKPNGAKAFEVVGIPSRSPRSLYCSA